MLKREDAVDNGLDFALLHQNANLLDGILVLEIFPEGEAHTVRIRVVPGDCGYHAGLESGRFVILDFGVDDSVDRPEPPVVYVETLAGSTYLDKPAECDRYRRAFADIAAAATGTV